MKNIYLFLGFLTLLVIVGFLFNLYIRSSATPELPRSDSFSIFNPVNELTEEPYLIDINKGVFVPDKVSVVVGTRVVFTNNDEVVHQIFSQGYFKTDELASGESGRVDFTQPGTFEYRSTGSSSTGVITVNEPEL